MQQPAMAPAPVPAEPRRDSGRFEGFNVGVATVFDGSTPATAQTGTEGVNLALQLDSLKSAERVSATGTRQIAGRTIAQFNGVWTDLGLTPEMKAVKVKVMSDAYFLLLKKHPELKEVFQLGNRIVWVTPSGTVLVVGDDGSDKMSDDEIDKLFVAKK
jgi:Ca-activated chloride channel homolog